MSGQEVIITAADLAESARAYDPALHEAPLVVGHPRTDAPAYGWVSGVESDGVDLFATPHQVDAQFAEMVNAKHFKKRSSSFYPPDHPRNPVPGVWYLKHVGFLGAVPPVIKGLKDYEFAEESGLVTVEFGEYDDLTNSGLWRRLREWIIGKFGQDEADKVVPGWDVASLEQSAQEEIKAEQSQTPFSEPSPQEEPMTEAERKQLADLEAQNATLAAENNKLKSQEAEFAESQTRLKDIETAARRKDIADFVDVLVKAGRVLPADKIGLAAFMEGESSDAVIEFGEGDAKVSKPGSAWLREFLERLPVQVDFSERSAADGVDDVVSFAAPDGYGVDAASMALHIRALAHQKAHPDTDYLAAVKAVNAQ